MFPFFLDAFLIFSFLLLFFVFFVFFCFFFLLLSSLPFVFRRFLFWAQNWGISLRPCLHRPRAELPEECLKYFARAWPLKKQRVVHPKIYGNCPSWSELSGTISFLQLQWIFGECQFRQAAWVSSNVIALADLRLSEASCRALQHLYRESTSIMKAESALLCEPSARKDPPAALKRLCHSQSEDQSLIPTPNPRSPCW